MFGPEHYLGKLYQQFHPGRILGERDISSRLSTEAEAKLVAELKKSAEGPPPAPGTDLSEEDKTMTFTRMIKPRKGRFPFLPKRVVDKALD